MSSEKIDTKKNGVHNPDLLEASDGLPNNEGSNEGSTEEENSQKNKQMDVSVAPIPIRLQPGKKNPLETMAQHNSDDDKLKKFADTHNKFKYVDHCLKIGEHNVITAEIIPTPSITHSNGKTKTGLNYSNVESKPTLRVDPKYLDEESSNVLGEIIKEAGEPYYLNCNDANAVKEFIKNSGEDIIGLITNKVIVINYDGNPALKAAEQEIRNLINERENALGEKVITLKDI